MTALNREQEIRRLCEQRGIKVSRAGVAWRLSGRGVSLLVDTLVRLTEFDLRPAQPMHDNAIFLKGG